jgi:DUF971 family protein
MPLPVVSEKYEIQKLGVAGYYALDVGWGDGHGSIYPFRDLRPQCPCDSCRAAPTDDGDPRVRTPTEIAREGGVVRIRWEDGHESRYPVRLLRDLCRCALCAGERGPIDSFLGRS